MQQNLQNPLGTNALAPRQIKKDISVNLNWGLFIEILTVIYINDCLMVHDVNCIPLIGILLHDCCDLLNHHLSAQ